MNVCIVSFSSRKSGNCAKISDVVASMYPGAKRYNFSQFKISGCGECKYQCFERGDKCPHARDKERELLNTLTNSDLAIFIVPNYCDYPCSNYFAFNERSICYFQNNDDLLTKYLQTPKKFIVVSNTKSENFQRVFSYQTVDVPEIMFLSAYEYGKTSTDGDIVSASEAVDELKNFLLD